MKKLQAVTRDEIAEVNRLNSEDAQERATILTLKASAARKAKGETKPAKKKGIALINFFPGYIGQTAIIGELDESLTLEKRLWERPLPLRPFLFTGRAGLGKTELAEAFAKARGGIHGEQHILIRIPCGISRAGLIDLLAQHATPGRPVTFFVDECHALVPAVRNLLKPVLETGGTIREVPLSDKFIFESNPFLHQWIFASNEDCAAKDTALFGATGRCTSLHFDEYSIAEKIALFVLCFQQGNVVAHKDALTYLESRVWNNARAIMREMGPEIRRKAILAGGIVDLPFAKAFCSGALHAGISEAKRGEVARYNLGLRWIDIKTLLFLAGSERGKLVGEVSQHCGAEPAKETSYRLQWLASLDLTATLSTGRKGLAMGGAEYLNKLQQAQLAAKGGDKAKDKVKPTGKASAIPPVPTSTPIKSAPPVNAPHKAPQTPAKVPSGIKATVPPAAKSAPVSVPSAAIKLAQEAGLVPATV